MLLYETKKSKLDTPRSMIMSLAHTIRTYVIVSTPRMFQLLISWLNSDAPKKSLRSGPKGKKEVSLWVKISIRYLCLWDSSRAWFSLTYLVISLTCTTFHEPISWLKTLLSLNIPYLCENDKIVSETRSEDLQVSSDFIHQLTHISNTFIVFHEPMLPLKELRAKSAFIEVTLPVSQVLRSPLKPEAAKVASIFVTIRCALSRFMMMKERR